MKLKGFKIVETDYQDGIILAKKNMSLWSYGEDIEVSFIRRNNSIEVIIQSFTKGIQLFTYGVNDENEKIIFNGLKNRLSK